MKPTAEQLLSRMFMYTGTAVNDIIPLSKARQGDPNFEKLLEAAHNAVRMLLAICASPSPDLDSFAGIRDFSTASLVYFRGFFEGKIGSEVNRIVQIPLYFQEVKVFSPLSAADIAARERFARRTGFLLLGPDECLAIEHQRPGDDYQFVDTYENNDAGAQRNLAGYYANSLDYCAKPRKIGELNVTETKRYLEETRGSYMWWHKFLSDSQIYRLQTSIRLLEEHAEHALPERKSSGAIIRRSFIENGSTESTADLRPRTQGWIRYPTSQDAWYFGVWINPVNFQTLTYAEQDVTQVFCDNPEQFRQELKDLALFYGKERHPSIMGYDPGMCVSLGYDSLTLLKGKTVTVIFDGTGTINQDTPSKSLAPIMVDVPQSLLDAITSDDSLLDRPYKACQADEFAINILDPIAFDDDVEMELTHQGDGQIEVALTLKGQGVTHKKTILLETA